MTLFELDLLKPPGRLLLQYDTWQVVSRGVLQNVSSRLSRRNPFQAEFWASNSLFDNLKTIYNMLQCKRAHVTWDLVIKPLLAKEKPLQSRPLDANRRLEKQGGLKPAPESSDYFQTQSLQ